jgi:hypothetical protein
MPNNELGKPRRSQVIHNFGPGAIVDFGAGANTGAAISVVVSGLEEWDRNARPEGLMHPQVITEPRLQRQLKVKGFRLPPVNPENSEDGYKNWLIGVRFPQWLQCPVCNRLKLANHWTRKQVGDPARYCTSCEVKEGRTVCVGPVRFIVACANGHLDEFPWNLWVRHTPECPGQDFKRPSPLKIQQTDKAGLAGLLLVCTECKASKPLEGIFGQDVLKKQLGYKCQCKNPWLGTRDNSCDAEPRVLQRGASNVYFSSTASALDIPPWADGMMQRLGIYWEDLVECDEQDRAMFIRLNKLEQKLSMTSDEILAQVKLGVDALSASGGKKIRYEEYEQFTNPSSTSSDSLEFQIQSHTPPPELATYLGKIVQAKRLREVRAIWAFTRITPPADDDPNNIAQYAKIKRGDLDWLPAIEVRGEGIFLTLDEARLKKWELTKTVQTRAGQLHDAWLKNWQSRRKTKEKPNRTITPRFVLLHSLAHALIRQLSLECGYSSSALRERLYVDSDPLPMAGLLIYTATPDSEGTLGGLVRQGLPRRIAGLVPAAIRAMRWCSNDPLCIKDITTLSDPTNLAACHACMMISETSCEEFNCLLDRAMLVGLPEDPAVGFFSDMLVEKEEL